MTITVLLIFVMISTASVRQWDTEIHLKESSGEDWYAANQKTGGERLNMLYYDEGEGGTFRSIKNSPVFCLTKILLFVW